MPGQRTWDELTDYTLMLLGDPLGERYDRDWVAEEVQDALLDLNLTAHFVKDEVVVQILADVFDYDVAQRVEADATKHDYAFPLRVGYSGDDVVARQGTSALAIDQSVYSSDLDTGPPSSFYRDTVSPGHIAVFPVPTEDGEALPSEVSNLTVSYVGLPTPMEDGGDYPDAQIPGQHQIAACYKAAGNVRLCSADKQDLLIGIDNLAEYERLTAQATGDSYRNLTAYADSQPV